MMAQPKLSFQYKTEKKSTALTRFAGLLPYVELAHKSGLIEKIRESLQIKQQGWTDTEIIMSLILLNLAGGDHISDINLLAQDEGFNQLSLQLATYGMRRKERRAYEKRWRKEKTAGVPSNAAIHRYLPCFHSPEEEKKREPNKAFIPKPNEHLRQLLLLNRPLIETIQAQNPVKHATLDMDATLTTTYKRQAYYCYKKYKAYQPFNIYWAEHDAMLYSEFRDGHVPAGYEQCRLLETALNELPADVKSASLRSDSAGYQKDLLIYCAEGENERFGVIPFAVAAKVSPAFRTAVSEIKPDAWQTIETIEPDGTRIPTGQQWAEVCFVPDWVVGLSGTYRFLAIREPLSEEAPEDDALPFQTMSEENQRYKLFGIVSNEMSPGNELILWHRKRCGKSEGAHHTQKTELAGGQLPSNLFGSNAAWWQIMVLSFNLHRLMQIAVLPSNLKNVAMKAVRFHIIDAPGRLVAHARGLYLNVSDKAFALYNEIRRKIVALKVACSRPLEDTS